MIVRRTAPTIGISSVSKFQLVNVMIIVGCLTFTEDKINNCDEKDKSSFWSGCNVDFALSVGCNENFALGVVMIILFYKIK